MKTISIEDIRKCNPCYDPAKYLPEGWQGTALDILNIDAAPAKDRIWVCTRDGVLPKEVARYFAIWCARQVTHLMKNPLSLKALDDAEKFLRGEISKDEFARSVLDARDAAYAAADAAAYAAAAAYADAAAYATYAADAAAYATYAAADAADAAAYATYAAAYAATATATATRKEQIECLKKLLVTK